MSEIRHLHLRGALGQARMEMLDGREHLVVPVVALMEGVISPVNAATPEFVSAATLAKAAASWNGRPVVLGHPVKDGRQCSANAPGIWASHGIGTIFNSRVEGKKLLQEAWIDKAKLERLHPAMHARLLSNEMGEVSVGAMVVTENRAGDHGGKPYRATWAETAGDHLAFLPGGRGACSIEMGCGSHRAAEEAVVMHLVTAEGLTALYSDDQPRDEDGKWSDGIGPSGRRTGVTEGFGKGERLPRLRDRAEGMSDKSRRSHDGYGGSPTPTEGDRVKIMGKVHGAGKRGMVSSGSSDGSFVYVKDDKGESLGSYHVSDLKVLSQVEDGMSIKERILALFETPEVDEEAEELKALEELRAAIGKTISAKNMKVIQATHDASHEMHDHSTELGATCDREWKWLGEVKTAAKKYKDCAACDGSGSKDGNPCESCDGTGHLKMDKMKAAEEATESLKAACACREGDDMKREDRIAALLKHEHSPVKSQKMLEAATDDELKTLEAQAANAATLKAAADETAAEKKAADEAEARKKAKEKEDLKAAQERADTAEAKLKAAEANQVTDEMKALVAEKKAADAATKADLVGKLKVAAAGAYTEEELNAKPIAELQKIATLAKVEAPSYAGRGVPVPRSAGGHDYAPPDPYEKDLKALQARPN